MNLVLYYDGDDDNDDDDGDDDGYDNNAIVLRVFVLPL